MKEQVKRIAAWRVWSLIASAMSGLVVVIAFLIPSFEDQYDRYRARQVVEGYKRVGMALMDEKQYKLAEEAFSTAFELSSQQRLDIEVARLRAKIEIINEENEWGTPLPRDLKEIDFLYFLHLSEEVGEQDQISLAHSSYAIYLGYHKKYQQAEEHLRKAIEIYSGNYGAYVDLGNVLDQRGQREAAAGQYKKAIEIRPTHYLAYYNLGILQAEQGKLRESVEDLKKAYELYPRPKVKEELDRVSRMKVKNE